MSFSLSALSGVAAKSILVWACLAALSACGGEPGALFTASGVSDGGAGGTSASGGAHHAAGSDGSAGSTAGATAHDDGGALGHAGGSSGMPPGLPGPMPGGSGSDGSGMHSACDGKMTEPPALIADFEQGVTGWSSYTGNSGNTLFGAVTNTQPGAETTAFAATFAGGKAETSGMFHTLYCSDVSKFDGISFWAKGRGGAPARFLAVIPATDPTSGFGDCDTITSVCSDHPGMPFTLSDQWQAYHVAWSDLVQYGWGSPAKFAGVLNAVLWINDGPVQQFELSIDQVELYKGDPPA
jgi:hypothetical protein